MDKQVYCDNCCNDVEYEIQDELVNVNLKGIKFTYGAFIPHCKECQSEVSVPEINDLNIIRAYKAQKEFLENSQK